MTAQTHRHRGFLNIAPHAHRHHSILSTPHNAHRHHSNLYSTRHPPCVLEILHLELGRGQ